MDKKKIMNWVIAIIVAIVYLSISIIFDAWAYSWLIWVVYAIYRFIAKQTNYNLGAKLSNMKKEKIDKGFELLYENLSYRRKFIRTLWLIPIGIVIGIVITYISIIVSIFYWIWFIIVAIKQLKYNYTMWKNETNK